MNIMYFIYGEEQYLIDQKIKDIINEFKNSKIIFLDSDAKLDQILNEILSFSLFDSSKLLILKNLFLLSKKNENETNVLIESLKYVPETTNIIFSLNKNIDKTENKLVNFLKKSSNCYEFNYMNEKELNLYIKKVIHDRGGIISDVNLFYFLSRVPHKLIFIMNEINKLLLFDKNITKQNINDLIPKYDTNKIFDFINAFNEQNIEHVFKIYYERINQGETITSLISQLSNTLEFCSQIYSYKNLGKKVHEIANLMKKHVFTIKKNNELLNKISYSKIKKYLINLADLDLAIKQNKIDDKVGFENFLLNVVGV